MKDGKLQMAAKKESDNFVVKKGKGKKPKQQKESTETKAFNVDFAVINKFGLVQVSPPISAESLESKITELEDRQKRFARDGTEELDKERADIEKNVEKLVEEDIEAEVLAAQDELDDDLEETKEKEEKKAVRPQRMGIKKPKDEFFDGSSDEENELTQSAYAKPSRGGGQQVRGARGGRGGRGGKRANVGLNEDDFPTL